MAATSNLQQAVLRASLDDLSKDDVNCARGRQLNVLYYFKVNYHCGT